MFFKILTFVMTAFFLTACGLKGPLYMPKDESAEKPAQISADAVKEARAGAADETADDIQLTDKSEKAE